MKAFVALSEFCASDPRPREVLTAAGWDVVENTTGRRLKKEELIAALGDADAVLAGVEPYDLAVLTAAPHLRCISRVGAGTDNVDLAAAAARGVAVMTTPDEVAEPVAQLTVAMLLGLARNVPQHLSDARDGQWKKHTGFLLREWTIGLLGFGRIAQRVEAYLRPFGPKILACDPVVGPSERWPAVTFVDMATLLSESDVVSLHASTSKGAGALIGAAQLAAMKRGSRLVNTGRGHLVDESALVDALTSGQLAGAALDVFGEEPYNGPLFRLPQVLCTPHVATLTRASRVAMELRCAENVLTACRTPR
jgi:D-3-phosphoglycerate dehydrogenase